MKSCMKSNIDISKGNWPELGKVLCMFNIYIIKCTFFVSHKNFIIEFICQKNSDDERIEHFWIGHDVLFAFSFC
jgi:hypothetical protein